MFDLHDSMRRAKRVDEVQTLYNTTFKAVTDAYFKGVRTAEEFHGWEAREFLLPEKNRDAIRHAG